MLAGSRRGSSSATRSGAATTARPTSGSAGSSRRAVEAGLRPILCVGEQLEEREAGRATDVVDAQLRGALAGHDPRGSGGGGPGDRLRAGLGDRDRPQRRAARTRRRWPRRSGPRSRRLGWDAAAAEVPVLYGGSVTAANIGEFLAEPTIDGALVGGASLKVDEMAGIVARAGVTAAARRAAVP